MPTWAYQSPRLGYGVVYAWMSKKLWDALIVAPVLGVLLLVSYMCQKSCREQINTVEKVSKLYAAVIWGSDEKELAQQRQISAIDKLAEYE